MYEILMVAYLVVAIALVGFILIQQGKGAGMGSAFGSGASGTVFGASGSGNFLTKTTTFLAVVFFGVALGLGNLTSDKSKTRDENTLFSNDGTEQENTSDLPGTATDDLPTDFQSDLPVESQSLDAQSDIPLDEESTDKKEEETKDPDSNP